jgi:simple sugar transport system ATP-binding protein
MTATPMLEMRGITKRFPGVLANDRVDFDVLPGEIHTLLGENGAGKSTLMRILYGLYRQDAGQVLLHGEPVEISGPADAIAHGVGMIHQHFMLVPTLTVAENVALGLRSSRGPLTDLDAVSRRIEELAEAYRLRVDPRALVWQLAVGERQRIEIIKALYRDASLLVLDEPTAVLTPQEVDDLFVTLRRMAEDGRGLIFISHKLREVLAISDRITVLRAGRVTGHTTPAETDREELAHLMVGRAVKLVPDRPPISRGEVRLAVTGLRVTGDRGTDAVRSLDLEAVGGEILGIAGVSGNGQRELAEAIAGLRPVAGGTVTVDGKDVTGRDPSSVRAAGLAYIPEERMRDGVIGEFTVTENLILVDHTATRFIRGRWFLRFGAIKEWCGELIRRYAVKTPRLDTPTRNLSGGNIQKLILARELSQDPVTVLLACQPTRGVDIGASEYIHAQLVEQRERGVAIVVVSEDLDEVLALSDRIAVMYEGQVVAVVDAADAVREQLGLLMAGSGAA